MREADGDVVDTMSANRLVADQHRVIGAVSICYTFLGEHDQTEKLHICRLTGSLTVPSKGGHDTLVLEVGAAMIRRTDLQQIHID